jgi:sugar phosphate isomerase/epimerase
MMESTHDTPSRRQFLRLSALAAASGCVLGIPPTAYASSGRLLYGVQLYTVRKEQAADFPGLLRALRQIGFTQLELNQLAFTRPATTLRKMIEDAGLSVPSSHLSGDIEAHLDYARQLGLKYVVTMLPRPNPTSLDDYRAVAAKFNRWGAGVRDQGMQFAFLSHGHEFLPQEGSTGFEQLMQNTDPALVKLEVDIYWLVQAGVDPADFLRRYRNRICLLHVKDRIAGVPTSYAADATAEHFTELGKGTIAWPALLHQARRQGIRYVFIDQDKTEMPVLESLKQSFAYLRTLKL